MSSPDLVGPRPTVDRGWPSVAIITTLAALGCALSLSSLQALALLGVPPLSQLLSRSAARRVLARRLLTVAPVAVVAMLGRVWAASGSSQALTATCALLALRIVVAALWMTWLTSALSPHAIDAGLGRLGVPAALLEVLALTRRFSAQLQGTLNAAWSAAALRGGFASLRTTCSTLGPIAGVVIVRALDRTERVSEARALRGHAFGQEPPAP